jgi:hypothetical protein
MGSAENDEPEATEANVRSCNLGVLEKLKD